MWLEEQSQEDDGEPGKISRATFSRVVPSDRSFGDFVLSTLKQIRNRDKRGVEGDAELLRHTIEKSFFPAFSLASRAQKTVNSDVRRQFVDLGDSLQEAQRIKDMENYVSLIRDKMSPALSASVSSLINYLSNYMAQSQRGMGKGELQKYKTAVQKLFDTIKILFHHTSDSRSIMKFGEAGTLGLSSQPPSENTVCVNELG